MSALWPRFAPASLRLHELLQYQLGSPRLLLCEQTGPRPGQLNSVLLDWCASLFNAVPASVRASHAPGANDLFVDFGEGCTARLHRWSGPHARAAVRLRVVAEKGVALVDLPHRVCWTAADGRHAFTARCQQSIEHLLLERFHHAAATGEPMQPSLEEAGRAFRWMRAGPNA
jgi:hypothetical protein